MPAGTFHGMVAATFEECKLDIVSSLSAAVRLKLLRAWLLCVCHLQRQVELSEECASEPTPTLLPIRTNSSMLLPPPAKLLIEEFLGDIASMSGDLTPAPLMKLLTQQAVQAQKQLLGVFLSTSLQQHIEPQLMEAMVKGEFSCTVLVPDVMFQKIMMFSEASRDRKTPLVVFQDKLRSKGYTIGKAQWHDGANSNLKQEMSWA